MDVMHIMVAAKSIPFSTLLHGRYCPQPLTVALLVGSSRDDIGTAARFLTGVPAEYYDSIS
jgi:hypothetical protein